MAGETIAQELLLQDGANNSDSSLRPYIADLVASAVPYSAIVHDVQPTIRRWKPIVTSRTNFKFADRHPLFVTADPTVEVRKPRPLSRSVKRGWRGVFQSRKVRRPVLHYTGLELDLFRYCEVDQTVTAYLEHPARIRRPYASAKALLPLSGYVERDEEQWFIICRWEQSAARPESERIWSQLGIELSEAGFGFEVVTENHFGRRPISTNVETILRGRWCERPPDDIVHLVRSLAQEHGLVGDACIATGLSIAQMWQLVLDGIVGIDLTGEVDEASRLYDAPFRSEFPIWSRP